VRFVTALETSTADHAPNARDDAPNEALRPTRSVLRTNLVIALTVWLLWLGFTHLRGFEAIANHYPISIMMVFGSFVAGSTSEGGGAIAFPVMTKLLHVPADQARMFTYAIQSVGMTSASLSILFMRVRLERRILLYATPPSIVAVILSATLLAPRLPLAQVRIFFTVLLVSLGIALLIQHIRKAHDRNLTISVFGGREVAILIATGFLGGIVSGLVGIGENTVAFIVLVLLFRVSEKVATPTTVILMTIVSLVAFGTHVFIMRDFIGSPVPAYWLAAAPVVTVFAPLGALLCSRLSRTTIRFMLFFLISAELISTLILVHIPVVTRYAAAGALIVVTTLCYLMTRVERYHPRSVADATPPDPANAATTGGSD
jgi:uncharacterized membrane protein YfcA